MNENAVNQIKDALREVVGLLVQRGQPISQELRVALTEAMNHVASRIQELRSEGVEGEAPQAPSEGVNLLWILSGGDTNAFVNYMRTFPGEDFSPYLRSPQILANLIQGLQQTNPIQRLPFTFDGIEQAPLQSSNVWGMKYSPKSGKLMVRFQSGSIYQYDGVPAQIFQLFSHGNAFARTKGQNQYGSWWPMKNPSLGAALNQYIKAGGYNYRRVR